MLRHGRDLQRRHERATRRRHAYIREHAFMKMHSFISATVCAFPMENCMDVRVLYVCMHLRECTYSGSRRHIDSSSLCFYRSLRVFITTLRTHCLVAHLESSESQGVYPFSLSNHHKCVATESRAIVAQVHLDVER
jgi:hypothetical protein